MAMKRALAALAAALVLALPATGALAHDSPTYGYDYQRTRQFSDPAMSGKILPSVPWVVPISGSSSSTPVEYGNILYQFTHYFGGSQFAFWSVSIAGSTPGVAREVFGPVTALPGESFGNSQVAGLGVSPGGRYVAVAAGESLFWWPTGNSAAVKVGQMLGPNRTVKKMSSGDPVFVAVPVAVDPSGWAVCGDDWDGSLWCFGVSSGSSIYNLSNGKGGVYYTTMDLPADTSASITASPTLVPASGSQDGAAEVCAGVSGTGSPRVACIHPTGALYPSGKPYTILGAGGDPHAGGFAVSAPYAAGRLVEQDVWGRLYQIDTLTGAVIAHYSGLAEPGVIDAAAPALLVGSNPNGVVAIADGYSDTCIVDFHGGGASIQGCLTYSGANAPAPQPGFAPGSTPVTAIATGSDIQLWQANNQMIGDARYVNGGFGNIGFADKLNNNFSTLVADVGTEHAFVLWDDTAAHNWCTTGNAAGRVLGGCPPADRGGLQIWYLAEPLTAWFDLNAVPAEVNTPGGSVPPGGECLFALAKPGEFAHLSATLPDGGTVAMHTDATGQGSITGPDTGNGPLFADNVTGCPNPATTGLFNGDSYYNNAAKYFNAPDYPNATAGTDPTAVTGPYQLWWANGVKVPGKGGAWTASVGGTTANGAALSVQPVLYTTCPNGYDAGSGGVCTAQVAVGTPPPTHTPPEVCSQGGTTCYPAGFACMFARDRCVNEVLWK